jgi:hypothetical protein
MKEKPMNPPTSNQHDPDMLDEYDFSAGIRGKYAERYYADRNLIRLDEDVAKMFPMRNLSTMPCARWENSSQTISKKHHKCVGWIEHCSQTWIVSL